MTTETEQSLDRQIDERLFGGRPARPGFRVNIAPYSTDIAAAFDVVEKMRERGWDHFYLEQWGDSQWAATFEREEDHDGQVPYVIGDTAAKVIAESALKALEMEAADNTASEQEG